MAETAGFDIRRYLLFGGVLLVVVFSSLFFVFRSCAPVMGKKAGYSVIYSNLELKDAANVIARLKEINIEYEIRNEGRAIAVPKDKADQARLGLAEKKLPAGGVVGWEIFDESRLGATDFERRIQLIRAISGELSRTIRILEGVEDVRVQIVIPETKLFAINVSPVTASVLLRLKPGFDLSAEKIKGIVHLVASSVENLQPENVTVIDDTGRILSLKSASIEAFSPYVPSPQAKVEPRLLPEEVNPVSSTEVVLKKEVVAKIPSPSSEVMTSLEASISPLTKVPTLPAVSTGLTVEEKILHKAQVKREMEQELSSRAQELLNRFYPINGVIVKINLEVKPAKETEIRGRELKIKKINAIILVDNRMEVSPKMKKATFMTVASAIGYNRKRGDQIIIQKVPFHLAFPVTGFSPKTTKKESAAKFTSSFSFVSSLFKWGGFLLLVIAVIYVFRFVAARRQPELSSVENEPPSSRPAKQPLSREKINMLDQVRGMAERNPEKIAELIKSWLSE